MKEKIINILKNNKYWCLLCISFIGFLVILINVLNGNIQKFDTFIYNTVISIKTNDVTNIFKTITEFGDALILITIAIVCLIIIKNKKIGGSIAINLASIGLLNYILKNIIQRPRPEGFRLVEETGYSFPSGHSMASLAFYGLIIYFVHKNLKNKLFKNIICIFLSVLIFLIGISRIYLGVHYASDVLAGFAFGIVYLVLYITFVLKLFKIKE